jgi:hypothetical protein
MKTSLLPLETPIALTSDPEPVTIIGTVTDSSGRPACSGWVDFILQPDVQSLNYSVLPDIVVATPTRARIVAGGQLVADCSSQSPFVVWPNDLILPANTLYQVVIAPGGRVTRILNGVLISSDVNPQSMASLTFVSPQNQVVGSIVNANPLVTMSVVPGITNVWTIGTPTEQYLAGYFGTLYAGTIYADNIVGNVAQIYTITTDNVFGQPQPGQFVLLYTFAFQATFPPNFSSPASYANAVTPAGGTAVYTVLWNGTAVGTVTFSATDPPVFATAGFTANAGDLLMVTAPDPMDPILSDVAITFAYVGALGGPTTGPGATIQIPIDNVFGQPQPAQLVLLYTATQTITFPANFAGSYGTVGVLPTNTAVYSVLLNSVMVGSVTISPAGAFTFVTAGFVMNAGDRLTVTAPSPMDPTLSDVAITFTGML